LGVCVYREGSVTGLLRVVVSAFVASRVGFSDVVVRGGLDHFLVK
jgi:hypothetical protein